MAPESTHAVGGHGDGAESGEVDHPEHLPRFQRPVGQALVVVAAAAHAEAHSVHAAAPDGGLHVGGVRHGDDADRPRRGVGKERGVPDGGHQHVGEVGGVLREDELAGYVLVGQALDEAIGGGGGWSTEVTRGEADEEQS
jgi:hypothetical protein